MRLSATALSEAVAAFMQAGHGSKGAIATRFAEQWQCSVQTVYRRVGPELARMTATPRKHRSDRNTSHWTLAELELIAAALLESRRGNGKQLSSIEDAIDMLRANGMIRGEIIDTDSGEVRLLSASSAAKALRANRLHPDQLTAPKPKVELSTEHPNQLWEDDPSLCVLYYLRGAHGLSVMPQDEFYKNKPKNLERIESERVWRYVFTDHTSGAFYFEYVLGAESNENHCSTFINAMQARGLSDPFHGVPSVVMVDPGSANTSAMFNNLCASLGITVQANKPRQPWVKGQVEKSNDIIERGFEHRLRYHRVQNLAELNEAAWRWMRHFNATAAHTRHKSSRYQAWMTIRPEHLRLAPSVQECKRLATHAPVERLVNPLLRISFGGKTFDVSGVPGVIVGQKLTVTRNAFSSTHGIQALVIGSDGRRTWYRLEPLEANDYGFTSASVPYGEYRPHAATPADENRKRVERVAMDAATDEEAEKKRKDKALPFGGRMDPYKSLREAPETVFLPRRGTPVDVAIPDVKEAPQFADRVIERPEYAARVLGHVELAQLLRERIAGWSGVHFAALVQQWPDGATEHDLDAIARRLPLLVQSRRALA